MKHRMDRSRVRLGVILLGMLLVAVFAAGRPITAAASDRSVELTVYNDNLGLVKERRGMELPAGIGTVGFTDVASLIDPTSVRFRSLSEPGVRVLEQNYEYDIINDTALLQKYLGQRIRLTTVQGETLEGYLMSGGDNLILAATLQGGEVRIVKAAQIQSVTFPELPGGLVVRPTLVWLLTNPARAGAQQVEVSYLTGGLSWKADYVATINQDDNRIDLAGWVTLDNRSGADYRDARLKLVAGDLHRAPEEERQRAGDYLLKTASPERFQEQSFFEYHLYTLGRTTTVKNNQLKQVELLTAAAIPARKLFIYDGTADPKKVQVVLELVNSKANNLGMPLPKGRVRVQKADSDGALQFIGEDRIDHTAAAEKLRVALGNAFDIVGERIRTNVRDTGSTSREESYQITLRNHKQTAVDVTVVERMNGWNEWQIVKTDHRFVKTESGKAEFAVVVPPGGQETITYTVKYKW
ncbi:hypothetical protein EDC14_101821 [Hydrogenispora ethanolica]|uniref:DUF4139 domain-containing protein n=1 Tax=Hydrogenispora ethanolica TaxID=1082276 RepID=A0A4R1RFJ8_HYDET|nr:DUF4139 domain-containing protein [Hydrogenispora ethanolica]TCL64723.1 hypothetical protein EDC14_101821 [Hydrogenispora ethanolica]